MDIEQLCFEMICHVGDARSSFVESIQQARQKNFTQARDLIENGKLNYNLGHAVHARLVQKEMEEDVNHLSLIMVHAEDQMMSAENFKILSEEFLLLYQLVHGKS